MIKSFQIGNFKAFSDVQSIPLKPITIIFGPNSSGKSSVIHSLLLARHGVDEKTLDVTYPSIAGHSVDLGGFRQYIHCRNLENRLQWSAELDIASLPNKLADELSGAKMLSVRLIAAIELDEKGQPRQGAEPYTQICEYQIDGEDFLILRRNKQDGDFVVSQLNRDHEVFKPVLQAMFLSSRSSQTLEGEDSELMGDLIDSIVPQVRFKGNSAFLPGVDYDPDVLADLDSPVSDDTPEGFEKLGDLGKSVRLFLPRMLMRFHAGVQSVLVNQLKSLSYLGPLRSVPPRHMAFAEDEVYGHPAEGASAWKELAGNDTVRKKINFWLGDSRRLKTPYRLELEPFYSRKEILDTFNDFHAEIVARGLECLFTEAPPLNSILEQLHNGGDEYTDGFHNRLMELIDEYADLAEYWDVPGKLMDKMRARSGKGSVDVRLRDIKKNTPVSHRDVGIGISQVLPVLVNTYALKESIIAMEQPEIHLHPALQAELGDVFIESALGENKNRFVLETHSEHLILRILRRIRETARVQKNPELRNDQKVMKIGDYELKGAVPAEPAWDGPKYTDASYKFGEQVLPDITPDDIALIYVDTTGDSAKILNLRVDERGRLIDQCPGGFFEEDFEELF